MGELLVENVTRTAATAAKALSNPLPDLVVHWHDATFAWPLRIRDSKVQVEFVGKNRPGSTRRQVSASTAALTLRIRVQWWRPKIWDA